MLKLKFNKLGKIWDKQTMTQFGHRLCKLKTILGLSKNFNHTHNSIYNYVCVCMSNSR